MVYKLSLASITKVNFNPMLFNLDWNIQSFFLAELTE